MVALVCLTGAAIFLCSEHTRDKKGNNNVQCSCVDLYHRYLAFLRGHGHNRAGVKYDCSAERGFPGNSQDNPVHDLVGWRADFLPCGADELLAGSGSYLLSRRLVLRSFL